MYTIHILDENTANKIAAGEVVERPASVIKELVENSIDAGSTLIEIEIVDGGINYIRVTDNGSGMSFEDAKLAVVRHATSKIKAAEDLYQIQTLGFRGEALPSIAAVSKFVLTTRLHTQDLGTCITIHGGALIDESEAGSSVGTTVVVSELFFNTPARKKFLKSPAAESGHIHDIVTKLAIAHPEICFKLVSNNKLTLSTPGNCQLLDTLGSLYGTKILPDILPVNHSSYHVSISGYVAKPTLLKSSRHWQTFIVNSRTVSNKMIAKALDNAYHSMLPKNGYPLAVLEIKVPVETIDVNVHPQKSEIKFSDDQIIYRAVYQAVINALAEKPAVSYHPDETISYAREIPDYSPRYSQSSFPQLDQAGTVASLPFSGVRELLKEQDQLYSQTHNNTYKGQENDHVSDSSSLLAIGQIDNLYIVAKGNDALYVIDQHAAHERILYERFSQTTDRIPTQQLLIPIYLDFDAQEMDILSNSLQIFFNLGLTLEIIGPNNVRLVEIPADFSVSDAEPILRDILGNIQNLRNMTSADIRHAFLQTAACRTAIKAGDCLTLRQMQAILDELFQTKSAYTCPHGRPTAIRFGTDELAKMFKRT